MNRAEVKRRQAKALGEILTWIVLSAAGSLTGNNGVTYIAAAYAIFLLMWLPVGGGLTDSLGRLLRNRYNKGQYKNALKMRSFTVVFQAVSGALGSVLLLIAAQPAAELVFKVRYSVLILMVLAPTVFLRSISSVLLGYFQGDGSELPTAVAGVLRPLLVLGFGYLFAGALRGYGEQVSGLLNQNNFTAMYGGVGIAAAISVAEALILLLLFLIYRWSSRRRKRSKPESGMRTTDSSMDCLRYLYGSRWSEIVTGLLVFMPFPLGWLFYGKSVPDEDIAAVEYGLYVGKYLMVCGILISVITILALPVIGRGLTYLKKEEQRFARAAFQSGIHMCFVHGIFVVIFVAVMGEQLSGLLCAEGGDTVLKMFQGGSAVIFAGALSGYFARVLLSTGKRYFVMGSFAVGNVAFVISTAALLNLGKTGILALVYGGFLSGGIVCVLLGLFVYRQLRLRIDWLRLLIMPLIAGGASGLTGIFLKKMVTPHLGNLVSLIVLLVISVAIYWIILLLTRNFREQELEFIPGGKILNVLGQMLRVY